MNDIFNWVMVRVVMVLFTLVQKFEQFNTAYPNWLPWSLVGLAGLVIAWATHAYLRDRAKGG